jgi:hypothetical protein
VRGSIVSSPGGARDGERDMKIGIVGGLERNGRRYVELSEARGHELEFHDGHVAGRGRDAIAALVERSDVVIVQT